jgi:C_GCAxxG_C_C family probable redox protein
MLEKEYNCAQAIFTAYGEPLGLVDYDTSLKIASAFGGGIARMGNVCGALTGALMVLGLKYGGAKREEQEKANAVAGKLLNEFESLNGSIICRELINRDLITDEDVKQAFKEGAFNNCPKFVDDVSLMLEKRL